MSSAPSIAFSLQALISQLAFQGSRMFGILAHLPCTSDHAPHIRIMSSPGPHSVLSFGTCCSPMTFRTLPVEHCVQTQPGNSTSSSIVCWSVLKHVGTGSTEKRCQGICVLVPTKALLCRMASVLGACHCTGKCVSFYPYMSKTSMLAVAVRRHAQHVVQLGPPQRLPARRARGRCSSTSPLHLTWPVGPLGAQVGLL